MSFGFSFIRSHSGPGLDRHGRASRPYRGEPRTAARNREYTREIYPDQRERRAERKNEGDRHTQQYRDQPPRHDAQANNTNTNNINRSTETQVPRYREHYGEEDVGKEEEEMRHPPHRGTQRKMGNDEKYYYKTSPRGNAEDVPSRQARRPAAEEGTSKERRGGGGGPRPQTRGQDDDGSGRRYYYDRTPQQQQQRQRQQNQRDASPTPRPRTRSAGEVVDEAYKQTHESWELQPIKHRRRPGDVPYEKSLAYHLTNSWWPKG